MNTKNKFDAEMLTIRIQDYNKDFPNILKGAKLRHLACEFTPLNSNISTCYSSDIKESDGIKQLFKHLKYDFDKNIKHIIWDKKQKQWLDINQNKLSIDKDEFIENILNNQYDKNLLITYYNIELNQDSGAVAQIICIFEFKSYKNINLDYLAYFVKYPTDFFTSPVMAEILNNFETHKKNKVQEGEAEAKHKIQEAEQKARRKIEEAEIEVVRLKSEIAATCHVMYRTIENAYADFNDIDTLKVSPKIKYRLENIRKRQQYIRLSMKLLNNPNPSVTITDFEGIGTIDEMIQKVWNIYVPIKCAPEDLKLAYETEWLKYIPFKSYKNEFFLVLWNLLHNADFHTDNDVPHPIVTCRVYESDNHCCIDITNQTKLWHLNNIKNRFENSEQSTLDGMGSKGLATIFIKCKKMNWVVDYHIENNKVTISLKTNLNIKQNV